jgi:Concanavalin A-like lectin/glucanases superfamily
MSIRFDNLADSLSRARLAGAKTTLGWFYISVDRNDYSNFIQSGTNCYLGTTGDGTTLSWYDGAGEDLGSGLTVGAWNHLAMVEASDSNGTTVEIYLNGALNITGTRSNAAAGTNMYLGTDDGGAWLNGRLTAVKMWSAALTAAEILAESRMYVPTRQANLWAFWPLRTAAETQDFSGNGRALTVGGTLTTEDGPPIPWGPPLDLGYRPRGYALY